MGDFGQEECDALGGVLYAGEECADFSCPEATCLEQMPNMDNGIFSDEDCDNCGTGLQVLAENFVFVAETNIASLTFWGGYYPSNVNLDDCFTVIFREDQGGVPGDEIDRIDCVEADEKEDTGRDLFGVDEYIYVINTSMVLPAGTFFVEIYNNSEGSSDSWFWETGDLDSENGIIGQAWTTTIPEEPWNYDSATDMALIVSCGGGEEETQVYFENFDSGMGDWAGDWAVTNEDAYSDPNSLTDSPGGNYGDVMTYSVQMTSDIDLTGYFGARLEFMTKYAIEQGFDYVYSYVSTDGGSSWIDLYTFNGEDPEDYIWHAFVADLGGFVGQSIRFKFVLETDAGYNADGMYIDDFAVYGLTVDNSPPLIIHVGPDDMTGVPEEFNTMATITDISGVESAWLSYSVDGGDLEIVNPDEIIDDDYYFIIPQVEAGAHVEYFITAADTEGNEGATDMQHYVSGTMIVYDDGDPEFIYEFGPGDKCATRFTPDESAVLVTGVIRLYTDINRPIDTVDVEVWANGSGNMPGASMIDPFAVWPMSTLEDPQGWTYVDFRGMGLTVDDDFHLGYTQRTGWPVILGDSPAVTGRSNNYMFGDWAAATTDFHIRAVVDYQQLGVDDGENRIPESFSLKQNYPNPFNASTIIEYAVTNPGEVELSVYNVLGQKVVSLAKGHHDAGTYSITWNANDVPSGVYFARVESSGHSENVKMVLLK
ncbi:MAG: T9SS type A sorting domain-containing protein [candidate division Zixibacteria bacterium]